MHACAHAASIHTRPPPTLTFCLYRCRLAQESITPSIRGLLLHDWAERASGSRASQACLEVLLQYVPSSLLLLLAESVCRSHLLTLP